MSYDLYLRKPACPTCGHKTYGPDLPNPTYNLSEIFDRALTGESFPNSDVSEGAVVLLGAKTDRPRGLRVISGMTGAASYEMIHKAIARLEDPSRLEEWRTLEPPNKWGTLETAIKVLHEMRNAAHECPDHVWEIH